MTGGGLKFSKFLSGTEAGCGEIIYVKFRHEDVEMYSRFSTLTNICRSLLSHTHDLGNNEPVDF